MQLGLYQHFKGNYYQVLGVCIHSETLEKHVIYQALYGDYNLWVRPLSMFEEKIVYRDKEQPRFKFIKNINTGNFDKH
ncbi:Uncharacterized protein NF27_IN00460 [Candidatus Jidaibacter acanthamoeba]|uniref:DUF1653 domain-containing protein n=1 Tax=Candidatus Jidaibacter acanthamoebae TaxID=86105 RepID=A0A0C1QWB8_9RICK|nr:DUF1653 domain-containing protein [Candidatus Jidaibacter acanthamoeba]KIE04305.1 Uncharacterized protein NF27_IN00460 [Candidatus Jidaibacter acanthamoeba]